ncbi:MAG TPA: hypothetical protein VGI28_01780 [Stellaceae bacterium]|jgi:hypothetical protein
MLVSDAISYAMRVAGILGVGQVALPQDTADAQTALLLMLQQWRQKRWLVFRLNWDIVPLVIGKQSYTVGPTATPNPDFVTDGYARPANVQSCFLRQNVGSGPNSYPIDFPMRILGSRQEYDRISLKSLQSWPASIYYDPTIPNATLYIWPIPVQHLFSLYIAWQTAIDPVTTEPSAEITDFLPEETQEAIIYNLALRLCTNYKMPPDPAVASMAKATLNTLRQTNFALQPLRMPQSLRPGTRLRNPLGGFYPETSAGIAVTSLG